MHPTLVLFEKSLRRFAANKPGMVITFLVPVVLIYIFGHVFGLYNKGEGGGGRRSGIPVAVVDQSGEPAAAKLIAAMRKETSLRVITSRKSPDGTEQALTEADVRRAIQDNRYRFAIILPADLLPKDRIGVKIKFLHDPRNEIEAQIVNGLLQKTIFTHVPELLGESLKRGAYAAIGVKNVERFNQRMTDVIVDAFGGDRDEVYRVVSLEKFSLFAPAASAKAPPADPSLRRLDTEEAGPAAPGDTASNAPASKSAADVLGNLVKIEGEQLVGKHVSNPAGARMVGGYAVMFLLFALSASATSIFEEKHSGIFQRILAAPVTPAHILWSRFLHGVAVGVVQLMFLFGAGYVLFGIDIGSHIGPLLCVTLATAAACTAFGLLVAAIAASQEAASGISTLLVLTMTAIGGAWFPVTMMPEFLQSLSRLSLVYWAVEGFTNVLWAGRSLSGVLPQLGVLVGITAVVMALAIWLFHRRRMFE